MGEIVADGYAVLIAAWNAGAIPPVGVTGVAFLPGDTVAQKLAKINSWTAVGPPTPCILQTYKIYNVIVPSEFQALTVPQQQLIRDIWAMGVVDASPGTNVRAVLQAVFAGKTTLQSLATLVAPFDAPAVPWWQLSGYSSPFNENDLSAAGGLL